MPQTSKPSKPIKEQAPARPRHQQIIDNIEKWVNSPGLQPPN